MVPWITFRFTYSYIHDKLSTCMHLLPRIGYGKVSTCESQWLLWTTYIYNIYIWWIPRIRFLWTLSKVCLCLRSLLYLHVRLRSIISEISRIELSENYLSISHSPRSVSMAHSPRSVSVNGQLFLKISMIRSSKN